MGYYQGDFYRGTRGDPFFGGLLGKLGGIVKGALGFPGGGLTKAGVESAVKKGIAGAIIKHPILSAAGAAGALGAVGAGAERMIAGPGMPAHGGMRGYHLCKSKHGCKHGQWVKNRHMNVTNPRALRRAVRRAHGFAKLAMRTIHLVHPKKKVRFGGFRKRRSKK
jgi:hypothetical protein